MMNKMSPQEDVLESNLFGLHLSFGQSNNIKGRESSHGDGHSWLSVASYNFEKDEGSIIVYDLDEKYYLKCNVPDVSKLSKFICDEFSPYNIPECNYDGVVILTV